MRARLDFLQVEARAALNHLVTLLDIVLQHLFEVEHNLARASRLHSKTMRYPERPDSSRILLSPSMVLARTRAAIFSSSVDLLTKKCISVTTIFSRPFFIVSTSVRARTCTRMYVRACVRTYRTVRTYVRTYVRVCVATAGSPLPAGATAAGSGAPPRGSYPASPTP